MHEATLMTGLMRQIAAIARAEGAARVTAVAVRIGALNHASPEHLVEHFDQASIGTIAEGARLMVTVAADIGEANAQEILLESVEVES